MLATRVRELEDALAEAHAARTRETHPLLSVELLDLKRPLEREAPEIQREPEAEASEIIDAVGSLCVTVVNSRTVQTESIVLGRSPNMDTPSFMALLPMHG